MSATLLVQRYAKALLQAAREEGAEERVFDEAQSLALALGENDAIRYFLREPLSKKADKLGVLLSSFPKPPHAVLQNFLGVVMENRRERFLPQMLQEFLRLCRAERGELQATLNTAFRLSQDEKELLERELSRTLKRHVELIAVTDRGILGGASLQVEDTLYDATLRVGLKQLEAALRAAFATCVQLQPRLASRRKAARRVAPKRPLP